MRFGPLVELLLARTAPVAMVIKVEDDSGELQPLEWIERLDWKSYALVPTFTRSNM